MERSRIEAALEELGLLLQGIVDNATAPQVGRFVGAKGIILGSYIVTKDNFLRISVRLINAESSEILAGKQVTTEVRDAAYIFKAIDQLALALLEATGYKLTEQ